MGKVWVKVKAIVRIDEGGQTVTKYPGDWAEMGKQQARESLSKDLIEILKPAVLKSVQDLHDCAILLRGVLPEPRLGVFTAQFPGVPIQSYDGEFPEHSRFLLWNPAAELKHELILLGFGLLDNWQLAAPVFDYGVLAESIGTAAERKKTKAVIHDLRVPVYDTRVLFVRQCRETRDLLNRWQHGSELKFLRSLYKSRPIVNALPPTWILK